MRLDTAGLGYRGAVVLDKRRSRRLEDPQSIASVAQPQGHSVLPNPCTPGYGRGQDRFELRVELLPGARIAFGGKDGAAPCGLRFWQDNQGSVFSNSGRMKVRS